MWSTLNGVAGSLSSAAKAGTGLAKGLLDAAAEEFRDNGQLQVKEKTSPREDLHWSRGPSRRKDVHLGSSEGIGNGVDAASSNTYADVSATRRTSAGRTNGADVRHTGKAALGANGQQTGWLSSAGQYIETINHIVVGSTADEELNKLRTQLQRLKKELLEVHTAHAEEQQQLGATYEQRINDLAAENAHLLTQLSSTGAGASSESYELLRLQSKLKRTESALADKSKKLEEMQVAAARVSSQEDGETSAMQQQQLDKLNQELQATAKQLAAATQECAKSKDDLNTAQRHVAELQTRVAASESDKQRLQRLLAEREEQVDELMEQLSSGQTGDSALSAQLEHERAQHHQARAELESVMQELQQAKADAEASNQALSERDAFWIKELDAERAGTAEKLSKAQADLAAAQESNAAIETERAAGSRQVEELRSRNAQLQAEKEQFAKQISDLAEQLKQAEQDRQHLQQRLDELNCLVSSKTEEEATAKLQEQLQLQQTAVLDAKREKDEMERRYRALLSQAEEEQEQLRQWLDEETNAHTDTKSSMEKAQTQWQDRVAELEQQLQELAESHAAAQSHVEAEHTAQLSSTAALLAKLEGEHATTLQQLESLQSQLEEVTQQRVQAESRLAELKRQLVEQSDSELEMSVLKQQLQRTQAEVAEQLQAATSARDEALEKVQQLESSHGEAMQKLQETEAHNDTLTRRVQQLEELLASENSSTSERQQEMSRQLSEAQDNYESLSAELERLQERLVRERESHGNALQERDTFWKTEMAGQARVHAQLEQQVQLLQQQLGMQDSATSKAREEVGQIREERDRLEQELQASRSTCSQLSEEVASLQLQIERSQAAAALHMGQEAALDKELMELRTSCARLQADNVQMHSQHKQLLQQQEQTQRDAERTNLQLEALRKERDQLVYEVDSVRQRCALLEEMAGGAGASSSNTGPSPELEQLQAQVQELQELVSNAEGEKDRLKQQLQRLKQQMLVEQDEEEEKIAWRVQQEVEVVSQRHQQAEAELHRQVEEAQSALSQLQSQSAQWEALLAAKDAEVENLQAALGELAYETEAHERLRQELRASEMRIEALKSEAMEANNRAVAAAAQQREAAEATQAAEKSAAEWRTAHAQLRTECRTLRQALEEAMKRVTVLSSDSSSLVDRRIIVKLLVTYFERGHSKEVLMLMARMLQLSPEEQKAVGLTAGVGNKGLLRSVAAAPFALVKSSLGLASSVGAALTSPSARSTVSTADSLADQWVDFLLQQVEQAQAGEGEAIAGRGSRPGSLHTSLGNQRNPFVPPEFAGSSHPSSPALSITRSDMPASPGIIATPTERENHQHQHMSAFPPRGSLGHHSSGPHHQDTSLTSHALPPMPASGSSITSVSSHLSHTIHPDWPQFGSHSHHAHQPMWSSAMGPPPPPPNPANHHAALPPHAYLGSGGVYRPGLPPHAVQYGSPSIAQHAAASPLITQSSDPATTTASPSPMQPHRHARSQSTGDPHPRLADPSSDAAATTPPTLPRYPRPASYDSLASGTATTTVPAGPAGSNPWPPRISVPTDSFPPSVPHSHSSSPLRPQTVAPSPSQLSSEFTTIDLNNSPQGPSTRHGPL